MKFHHYMPAQPTNKEITKVKNHTNKDGSPIIHSDSCPEAMTNHDCTAVLFLTSIPTVSSLGAWM